MPFDPINLGAAVNDRTGDDWRSGGTKINTMFGELFTVVDAVGIVFITEESDFPTQDATTITLEANTQYSVSQSFSTAKNFICENGSSFTCGSIDASLVSFTGTGAMFSGTDADFYIHDAHIDPGIGNEAYNFTDTIGGKKKFLHVFTQVDNCARFGTFTNMLNVQIENSNSPNADDGVVFVGTSGVIFSFTKFALTSTSSGFKGVDLGSATATVIEFSNLFFAAPAGAFGISGLANNGNVPAGRLGMVSSCEFLGGMTDLENITSDDVRWIFKNNNPTSDTQPDGLVSLSNNAVATTISATSTDGSNSVLVAGTWVEQQASHFTTTAAGRITYIGDKDIKVPIDAVVSFEPVSGTNKDIALYIALNGTAISETGLPRRTDSGNPGAVPAIWQLTLSTNDYLELFVENQTDTTNILVNSGVLRVL